MNERDSNERGADPLPEVDAELQREIEAALGDQSMDALLADAERAMAPPPDDRPGGGSDDAEAGDEPRDGDDTVELELKRGRIARVDGDDVFIDLMGMDSKLQGVVPLKQFERSPRVGSIMDFVLERIDEAEGLVHLSREGAITVTAWDQLTRGTSVEARVVATNKGGLELEMAGGIRAFMPASQIDLQHVGELEPFIGERLSATVMEVNRRGKRVLLSRRRFLEKERARMREKLMRELEVDQVRDGTVTRVMDYGAFVDLGGADGLLHISDMSYGRVEKPEDLVHAGQQVSVKILKIEPEGPRIRLGLKQIAPDPWEGVDQRYAIGEQVGGRVVRLAPFGVFIEVEPGVEGLVPISELSWQRIANPAAVCKEGDVLKLSVLQVDAARKRMSLSLKQAQGDPWLDAGAKYATGMDVEGTVVRLMDFGAFIEIEKGLEGLVHISEMADRHVNRADEVVQVGDRKTFRVLGVNEAERKMSLSLKAMQKPAEPTEPAAASSAQARARSKRKPSNPKGGMDKQGGMGIGLRDLKL